MSQIKITAETRTEFGKGAARRIRRDNKIPAVLYEHGQTPTHVTLPGHEMALALKNTNALFQVTIGKTKHLSIPRQVQRDPLRRDIEHVDLLIVKKGEKVVVDVPVVQTGEAGPDTLVVTEASVISLEVEATNIPNEIEFALDGLPVGTQILASDLTLPEGAELAVDPELMLVNIVAAPTAADVEAELDEAQAAAGIEQEAPDSVDEEPAADDDE